MPSRRGRRRAARAPGADRVEVAGSLRRRADSVKDLDIIATAATRGAVAPLRELELVESSQSGDAGARVTTHSGMKVDLQGRRARPVRQRAAALHGLQGPQRRAARGAVRRGLHVSEYGILDDETGETLRCATEEEVYERLGCRGSRPSCARAGGELEAARKDELPS
jgi:DNA polymerase (family 10)